MPVLIAGGGVAGAAAACLLGAEALLVEREAGPHHKICGEFLSVEACTYLRALGLDPAALGAAPVERVRLVHRAAVAEAALPFPAMGLSRRVLDEALLVRAASSGARVLRGRTVRLEADGVPSVAGLGRLPAHTLFLATGKHDLHGARRRPARPPEALVGLKMHLRLRPAAMAGLAGAVEILLFEGGYGGLQPIEDGAANLCVLLEQAAFLRAGSGWAGVQAMLTAQSAHLAQRLAGATPLLDRPLAITRVPYGFVHRADAADQAKLFRLGDQMAVIPSFAGDGVAMALHSAFRAVAAIAEGAPAYHHALRRELGPQIGRAKAIYRAGRAAPGTMVAAARLWPGAMRLAARATRLEALPSWAELPRASEHQAKPP